MDLGSLCPQGEKAEMSASPTNSTECRFKERKFLTVRTDHQGGIMSWMEDLEREEEEKNERAQAQAQAKSDEYWTRLRNRIKEQDKLRLQYPLTLSSDECLGMDVQEFPGETYMHDTLANDKWKGIAIVDDPRTPEAIAEVNDLITAWHREGRTFDEWSWAKGEDRCPLCRKLDAAIYRGTKTGFYVGPAFPHYRD
jgi:hypothetical protein